MKKTLLFLSSCLVVVTLITPPAIGQGIIRALTCRGGAAIDIRIDKDPSPDDPGKIRAVLRYQRATQPVDLELNNLAPNTCSWNPGNFPDVPLEPGVVYFDMPKEAQPWSETGPRMIDTTMNAAVHFPDMKTLPRYLSDPTKYFLFYVDDKTNFSISYIATKHDAGPPVFTKFSGITQIREKELLCRGGPSLGFTKGATVDDNKVSMKLTYPVSTKPPGSTGKGLSPGTCAWMNPVGMPVAPARIQFTTDAGNAQLSQASPTAAERWPDAYTIPAYMSNPDHFWIFKTVEGDPTTAGLHRPWKSSTAIGTRSESPSYKRSEVAKGPEKARPGASKSSIVARAQRLEFVAVDRKLDQFTIRFRARQIASPQGQNASPQGQDALSQFRNSFSEGQSALPQVEYSTSAPMRDPSTGRWRFPGSGTIEEAAVTSFKFRAKVSVGKLLPQVSGAEYLAQSSETVWLGTRYHFIITIPADVNGPEEQYTGQFMSIGRKVRITLTSVQILQEPHGMNSSWSWDVFSTDLSGKGRKVGEKMFEWQNPINSVRMIVGAATFVNLDGRPLVSQKEWELTPEAGMGLALIRQEFNTRGMTVGKRYSFTLTSKQGLDVVFRIVGYVVVSQH